MHDLNDEERRRRSGRRRELPRVEIAALATLASVLIAHGGAAQEQPAPAEAEPPPAARTPAPPGALLEPPTPMERLQAPELLPSGAVRSLLAHSMVLLRRA